MSSQPGTREIAYRVFAAEYDDADFEFSESEEERAPNFVVTPSGARVNRLFIVGVLTELEQVNEEMLRARVVDPTGAFIVYAGQYQPDELAFLEGVEPPTFLAVTGKARTFQPEDSDRVYTSVRPESISEVDADTRDRWVVDTAQRTLERVGVAAAAIETNLAGEDLRNALEAEGVEPSLAQGVALAIDHYGTTPAYLEALRDVAIDAVRVVADEREEVEPLTLSPDEGGGDAGRLADLDGVETDVSGARVSTETDTDETAPSPSAPSESSVSESTTEPASAPTEPEGSGVGVGEDFDEVETAAEEAEELGDFDEEFDPDEDVIDEEERQEIEEEYGTEFSTGTEVDPKSENTAEDAEPEPAEVETETQQPDEEASEMVSDTDEPEAATESDTETASEAEPGQPDDAGDVDPQDAILEVMADLDDGDGAERDAVVDRATEEFGLDADTAEDAIEDAMMSGQAYEPDEGKVKPI